MTEKKKDPKGDPNVQPYDNAFMQLKLNSMMPKHSPQLVVACTILVAVIFIPVGVAILLASDQIWEQEIRYDLEKKCTSSSNDGIATFANATAGVNQSQGCSVRLNFNIDQLIPSPVYVYYRIKGMHQNYRDFTDSVNYNQLAGYFVDSWGDLEDCHPLLRPTDLNPDQEDLTINLVAQASTNNQAYTIPVKNMRYNPCGAIAWSMFNDSFALYKRPSGTAAPGNDGTLSSSITSNVVCNGALFGTDGSAKTGAGSCTKNGIALKVDRDSRFQTSGGDAYDWGHNGADGDNYYLTSGYYLNEPGHKVPLATDEDFMVWARPAAMPDFRKLYRRIDTDLDAGDYVWDIQEFYDTSSFQGEKYIILATTSWVGGKNRVLGILFLAFGALSFVLAIVFFLIALVKKPAPIDQ